MSLSQKGAKNVTKAKQLDEGVKSGKKIFFCCCLSCIACTATLAALIALSVTVMVRISRIETSLQTVTDELQTYVDKNAKSVAEIKGILEALDYQRLNEAVGKLDKMDNIDVERLGEAINRINEVDFNSLSESISSVNANLLEINGKLDEISESDSEIENKVNAMDETLIEPIQRTQSGIDEIKAGLAKIPILASFFGG